MPVRLPEPPLARVDNLRQIEIAIRAARLAALPFTERADKIKAIVSAILEIRNQGESK